MRIAGMMLMSGLMACAPVMATVDADLDDEEPDRPSDDPRKASCDGVPGRLDAYETVPVTLFYEGDLLEPRWTEVEDDTYVEHTPTQREWSVIWREWVPDSVPLGNLDLDPERAGHGVLLAAYRASTCGMRVLEVEAWRIPEDSGVDTTYVEATVEDSGGPCEAEQWVGAAVAVPIADFPFSGEVIGCVGIVEASGE